MRILVTGATGFVGRYLCPLLAAQGYAVTAAVRSAPERGIDGVETVVQVGEIGPDTAWRAALEGQDAIIHLAARTHVMNETETDSEAIYERINVGGTTGLAKAAAEAGVRRLIYLSSVKALGESSGGEPLTEETLPAPEDAYGRTKREAEKMLLQIIETSNLEVVILRPPLIYGPGAKGNLLSLLRACDKGLPLPLGQIRNRRSLVNLENLADAIVLCLDHPNAANEIFLISDGEALSTPGLIQHICQGLGRPSRLLPFPVWGLRLAGKILGKTDAIDRLTGSLEVSNAKIHQQLDWTPPVNMIQGFERTAEWYLNQRNRSKND